MYLQQHNFFVNESKQARVLPIINNSKIELLRNILEIYGAKETGLVIIIILKKIPLDI